MPQPELKEDGRVYRSLGDPVCSGGKIHYKEQTFRLGYTFLLVHVIIFGKYYS